MRGTRKTFQALIKLLDIDTVHLAKIKKSIKTAVNEGFDINSKYMVGRNLAHYVVKLNVAGIIPFLVKLNLRLDLCDDRYDTPLHLAVKLNRYMIAKELVKCGADVNIGGELEQTPLHLAVIESNLQMIKLLINNGADIHLVDEQNLTPLDYAIDEKNEEIIAYLKKEEARKEMHL